MPVVVPLRAFKDNYIWLMREGAHAAVVDPGDAAVVNEYLERESLTLTAVLATHHHRDHVGGIDALLARWSVPVWGPANEPIPGRTHAPREGDCVHLPGLGVELEVLELPGHTAGHLAYTGVLASRRVLFCGDTLFGAGCGRLFEGTPSQMWSSLCKLAALPRDTLVYCAHEYTEANLRFASAVEPGNAEITARIERARGQRSRGEPTVPSTLGEELATNPFLRVREPAVRLSAEARAETALLDDVATFAAVRKWKDGF